MSECDIIDTFPTFLAFWSEVQHKPMEAQIEGWASEYMSRWPELLEKQLEDYSNQELDWRQIAKEKVFPFLSDRLPAMKVARKNLLAKCASVHSKAQEQLMFESDMTFVIYVGIACGAGWATSSHNSPAVLFGLEMIAECGWSQSSSIAGLIAHEIGHIVHKHWRTEYGKTAGSGPWWQLYTEGFAQRCEHVIVGEDSWHVSIGINNSGWLDWCQQHKAWLAAEFLRRVEARELVRPFFGSWFDIQGKRHTGHFLGHEVIKEIERDTTLEQIALLDNIEERFRCILENLAQDGT